MEDERVCIAFPPKVNSPGLLGTQGSNHLSPVLDFAAPRLLLQMFVFLIICILLHRFLKRIGLPAIFTQIIVGLILSTIGPLKTLLDGSSETGVEVEDGVRVLGSASSFGYMFFLFLHGVKMDPSLVLKAGWQALCIGILSVMAPVVAVLFILKVLRVCDEGIFGDTTLFLSVTYSMSSFPVIHCLLNDLKILNSELGRLGLSSAIVGDLFSLLLMTITTLVTKAKLETRPIYEGPGALGSVGLNGLFVALLIGLRFAMKLLIRRSPNGAPVKDEFIYAVIILFMFSPNIAHACGLFTVFGPFLLGLAVPEGPPLGSALVDKFDSVVSGVFLPLFTVTCALRVHLKSLMGAHSRDMRRHSLGVLMAFPLKFLITLLLPLLCKMPLRDSLALAFIQCTKGVVELATYSFMNDKMYLADDTFAIMVITVLVIATFVPLIVKRLYDPSRKYVCYQKRNIMYPRLTDELRVLTCIHLPTNVPSMLHLLHSSCPTRNSPIAVDVLHLVKLRGRATPLFISHDRNRKVISNASHSESVVLAFNQFQWDNPGAVKVNVFTAISPTRLMYEDICNLALDRLTSFIVLPFHRRRFADGSIESEDTAVRNINCNILDRSPCSVGILVEGSRHSKRCSSSDQPRYNMGMIFLGGDDDREALALAIRSAQDSRTLLTIVHLKAANDTGAVFDKYEKLYDNEVLRFVKDNPCVWFMEEEVKDGPETSKYLQSIVNEFDHIIVGRRDNRDDPQTAGLKEWSEFPELGIIGDLLASEDFNGGYSVLIVQQQQQGMTRR